MFKKFTLLTILALMLSLGALTACGGGDDDDDDSGGGTTDDTADDDLGDDVADDATDDTVTDDATDDTVTDDTSDDDDDDTETTTTTTVGTTTTTVTTTTGSATTTTNVGTGDTPRVAFQYVGSDGAWHALDDVLITDSAKATIIDEGFEGGSMPGDWDTVINNPSYSWDVYDYTGGAGYAYDGDYSAQISWAYDYSDQDEWMIVPNLSSLVDGDGPYEVSFWSMGSVYWSPNATLNVLYTCDDSNWETLYTFPGADETENWVWYQENLNFDCVTK